jgi:hypothetical protein
MSATTILEIGTFAIQTKVKFLGLSRLSSDNMHILKACFHGTWQLEMCIPKTQLNDGQTSFRVYIHAPPNIAKAMLGEIRVTLSVESLQDEEQATDWFEWDVDNVERGYGSIMDWNKFWHENSKHRNNDGFCITINMTSMTFTCPMVHEPATLRIISGLTQGHNIVNVKFLLFSQE